MRHRRSPSGLYWSEEGPNPEAYTSPGLRWGYGGGIGIGGILLIVLVVYLLIGRGRF